MRLKEKNTLKSECNLIVQSFFHNVKKTAGKKKSIKMKSYYCFQIATEIKRQTTHSR